MDAIPREVEIYDSGPFKRWMKRLIGSQIHNRILIRLDRVRAGNLGNVRYVGDGVWELKFDMASGPRVYYGEDDDKIIILNGGDKDTQGNDIRTAKKLWEEYNAKKDD